MVFVLMLLLLLCAGCESDTSPDTPVDELASLAVYVRDWRDDTPTQDVTVAVMSPETNTVVDGPLLTDAAGLAVFELTAGRYAVIAFPSDGRDLFYLPRPLAVSEDTEVLVLTRADPDYADEAPRLAGRVRDAVDGRLLDRVFVHYGTPWGSYLSAYRGIYHPGDDLTLSDGLFSSPGALFAQDPVSGNLTQLAPLVFTRQGYLPKIYTHDFPNGDNNTDLVGLEILMTPLSDGGTGVLTGHLFCLTEAVPGVAVGLSPVAGPAAGGKGGVGQPEATAVTDSAGVFRFDKVSPGTYLLHPSFLPDDGYSFTESATPVVLAADQLVDVGRQRVVFSVEPVFPLPEIPAARVDSLAWRALAAADSYHVYLGRAYVGATADTSAGIPPELIPGPGWQTWWVDAVDEAGRVVGAPESQLRFRVLEPGRFTGHAR